MKKDHPDRFDPVFVVDKATDGWSGERLEYLNARTWLGIPDGNLLSYRLYWFRL